MLGFMYEAGRGVKQDSTEAVKWYQLSAAQGNTTAQFNLGVSYANGRGLPQDYVLAHMWFNLAASRSHPGKERDNAIRSRDLIEKKMTPAHVGEAQRRAREWRPAEKQPRPGTAP